MGMAYGEWQEKLEELHRNSIHDDGCATMYPRGVCNCTKKAIRTGASYPLIPMGGALAFSEKQRCSECGRDLHGYRGPRCRYCNGTAE